MNEDGGPFEAKGPVFHPGETFHGYVIEKQIGQGGLGSIWLCRHRMLDTLFAIKVLDPEVAEAQPEHVERFVREAKLATRIRHPNLVAVHDAGYDESRGVYFLVMDYVKGDTLRSSIAFGGAMPEKEAVRIILQVANVLAAAQRFGMVHRDLKPENIMLTTEGTVKLLDLGIAKASGGIDSLKTTANSQFGTPAYISPEQAVDSSAVDARADVFSLGIILFELLCGRCPYMDDAPAKVLQQLLDPSPIPDVRTFNDKVSPELAAVLARMCAKERESRLASPKAVVDALVRLGHAAPSSNETEFAAEEDASIEDLMQNLASASQATPRADENFALETQDRDVQDFMVRLKRKRMRKRMLAMIAWAGGVCLLLLVAVLVWRIIS